MNGDDSRPSTASASFASLQHWQFETTTTTINRTPKFEPFEFRNFPKFFSYTKEKGLPSLELSACPMASSSSPKRDRTGKRPAVREDCPIFCSRIDTLDDIKDGKELPAAAVKKYRDEMGDHIFLKVPNCGEPWKVQLRKSPCGNRMWFEKGWEYFTNFYLLEQGDSVMFSDEGKHSHFRVRIIGWNDIETDYPRAGAEVRAIEIFSGSSGDEHENEATVVAISSGSSGDEHEHEHEHENEA